MKLNNQIKCIHIFNSMLLVFQLYEKNKIKNKERRALNYIGGLIELHVASKLQI